jgi:hypothetical protein
VFSIWRKIFGLPLEESSMNDLMAIKKIVASFEGIDAVLCAEQWNLHTNGFGHF